MDPIVRLLLWELPQEVVALVQQHLDWLTAGDYASILACDDARKLFDDGSSDQPDLETKSDGQWMERLFSRLNQTLSDRSRAAALVTHFCIGYAALLAYMQANVTGPPLPFKPESLLFSAHVAHEPTRVATAREALLASLACDGIAAYNLTTAIELLCVAQTIMASPAIIKNVLPARWIKMRTVFMRQRLLSEPSSVLESLISAETAIVIEQIASTDESFSAARDCLLLEQAVVQLHYGHDKLARKHIEQARKRRGFEYRLTGRLGKRTRYQQYDTSQLVVLAKSIDEEANRSAQDERSAPLDRQLPLGDTSQPKNLDLNDDTLLDRIDFSAHDRPDEMQDPIPAELTELDPSHQPILSPLDSIILLSMASSITNTSPEQGLTREETLPYAVRVLTGGSSNWQIYTQALLVRSRVEGFSSRTVERGLLQLQALVDQIIAETGNLDDQGNAQGEAHSANTFLPRVTTSESASVVERLRYVFQLASPMRWELEAELAARWVQLGGLRTALEIYERLHMWAETALCFAATEQEDKARTIVRRQLFHRGMQTTSFDGPVREPPPPDAPRLYCILGDLDQSIEWYEKAWDVSGQRYARAQRSIGRLLFGKKDYLGAVDAYAKSLGVNQLNQQSWFALGCALLELERFDKAVEAFSRCVQLDDTDAESWSNLAAALLRIDTKNDAGAVQKSSDRDDDEDEARSNGPATRRQRNLVNALKAFQRAASIKHDSYRIWHNILVTAASVSPPEYASVLTAQRRIIELRADVEGEGCVDIEILERLINNVIASNPSYDPAQPGLGRTTVKFMDEIVLPRVSSSVEIWRLLSRLAIWRGRPGSALDYEEKAWRAAAARPGWEVDNKRLWLEVVEATVRLCDAYESLGPKERTEGLGSGSGQLVAKDWKFKARSAVKAIMGKGKDSWEDAEGWERLKEAQQELKS